VKVRLERIGRWLVIELLRLYRGLLSPLIFGLFGPACRFEPSCSQYAIEAVRRFGVMRGTWIAARRLAHCHPLGTYGYDPVPERPASGRGQQ
jgi:uncharacterized protein